MIKLTVAEIKTLAEFAGLVVDAYGMDESDMEAEITVCDCPPEGIKNEGEPSDPDSVSHYSRIAYVTEYPEEGCIGLGPEVEPPQEPQA